MTIDMSAPGAMRGDGRPRKPSKDHKHTYPKDWDYTYNPAGSMTCTDPDCGHTIHD